MCNQFENLNRIASAYRLDNNTTGGVVLIWNGSAYGWKDSLRDPQHEKPGAIAVDHTDTVFVATGGNDYDGALWWHVL